MSMTDPVADLLTRMRNAIRVGRRKVTVPHSRLKERIVEVIKNEGYIEGFAVEPRGRFKDLVIDLKYDEDGRPILQELTRVSKPGRREYRGYDELGLAHNGLGTYVVSTSQGILADRECRERKTGGELLCRLSS